METTRVDHGNNGGLNNGGLNNGAFEEAEDGEPILWSPVWDEPGRGWAPALAVGRLAGLALGRGVRMLLAVGIGMLVAVVLIAAVPLYGSLMANVQLQAAINGSGARTRNVELVASGSRVDPAFARQIDATVPSTATPYLRAFTRPDPTNFYVSGPLYLGTIDGRQYNLPQSDVIQLTYLAYQQAQVAPHMRMVAGDYPQSTAPSDDGGAVQALVTEEMATSRGAKIGSLMTVPDGAAPGATLKFRVVGIWEPRDPNENFWNDRVFLANASGNNDLPFDYPIILAQQSFFSALGPLPDVSMEEHYLYYTDATRINTDNMATVASNLHALGTALGAANVPGQTAPGAVGRQVGTIAVITGLALIAPTLQRELAVLALPLFVSIAQVVGLALLFVAIMGVLLVEGQAGEIASLKSRGAGFAQLLGGYFVLGVVLAIATGAAGPFLASALALALARAFVPASTLSAAHVTSAYLAGLVAPRTAIVPAAAGALLGLAVVVFACQRAARRDVLAFRREEGRVARPALWRRLYLDLWLAGLCVVAYVELNQLGGVGIRELLGNGANSPVLLAAPDLLLVAGALIVLRVFPLAAGLAAQLAARGRGAVAMLALSQVARAPGTANRMALLLTLAVGLGGFALMFDATLVRNGSDRAAYQVGSDIQLVEQSAAAGGDDRRNRAELASFPGVEGVTAVFNGSAQVSGEVGFSQTTLMGIDPASFGAVAAPVSWRSDYAAAPISTLLDELRAHQWSTRGATPGDADHPIWALVSQPFASALGLKPGERFTLAFDEANASSTFFVAGAIINDFPTLYAANRPGGGVVVSLNDFAAVPASPAFGPTEYWLKTSNDPAVRVALQHALTGAQGSLLWTVSYDRRAVEAQIASNPIQAGMRGLLLAGALVAAVLAVLASIIQAALAARQRTVRFAVLRTLGMGGGQLVGLLLSEQIAVYVCGIIGGSLLALLLGWATLPFLQFSDVSADQLTIGVPPYLFTINWTTLAIFYAALVVALLAALVVAASYAARLGLGRALRLGED